MRAFGVRRTHMTTEEKARKIRRVNRILEAAASSAKTDAGRARIDEMQLHVDGYAEPGYSGEIVMTGDWNTITRWDNAARKSVCLDDTPGRVRELLEKIGVEIEWEDEWSTCDECCRLVRTSADSYSWKASYAYDDGGITCHDCIDPEDHLRSLEGNPGNANTIDSIDPSEHGYVRLDYDYEAGFHPGQDADPKRIGEALEKQGITRYLFQIDDQRQFDTTFSVYVHEDEVELLDQTKLIPSAVNGPSRSAALERGLQEVSRQMKETPRDGGGIMYSKVNADGTAETRVVSPEEFIRGIK
jgi:uncharacterized protein with PIN domain